jgi:hypothetical protein
VRYGNYVTNPKLFAPGSSIYLPRAYAAHLNGESTQREDGSFIVMANYQGSSIPVAFTIDPDTGIVTEVER